MPGKSRIYKLVSVFLLLALALVLMPKHLLAEHNHKLKICKETQQHFEERSHECSLCDFVLPNIPVQQQFGTKLYLPDHNKLIFHFSFRTPTEEIKVQAARGPPIV